MSSSWEQYFQKPPLLLGTLFWLHGTETEEQLYKTFRTAVDSGIGELVLESRPHWDYLGPKWWSDLKLLLGWSAQEKVKVYLFDEKWYPSGVAGHTIQKLDPAFRRMSIRYQSIRYRGPQSNVSIMPPWTEEGRSSIIGVYAYPRIYGQTKWEEYVNLTDRLQDDVSIHFQGVLKAIRWDIPEGDWLIVFIIADISDNYIDPMNPEAVQAFIERVYEASRLQLSEYFGNPMAGFFFDEPGYFCDSGKIPWSPGLRDSFIRIKGYDPVPFLAALWLQQDSHPFRYDFFDVLNSVYAVTYYKPIQDWCHKHRLKLIGHWYEHEACRHQGERFMFHEGLDEGPVDLFVLSRYVDEVGIDLVCYQVIPGEQNRDYCGLPKLGSSSAHVYNLKDDLAFSEAFGAYGWHIGLRMMKWLTDWQAVRGINHYILHAFNPRYPDLDCPPYYYDGGNNPEWKYFSVYVKYVNRISWFLRGGRHVAPILVLYPGAMGYAGQVFPIEDTQRFLQEIQYDYDLVSADILNRKALINGVQLALHKELYQGIIISGQEVITKELLDKLLEFAEAGVPVLFLYDAPGMVITGPNAGDVQNDEIRYLLQKSNVSVIPSHSELEAYLSKHGIQPALSFKGTGREGLRVLHRIRDDGTPVWFINNESITGAVSGRICLQGMAQDKIITALEPLTGEIWVMDAAPGEGNITYQLNLPPYRSLILIASDKAEGDLTLSGPPAAYRKVSEASWCIPVLSESIALQWSFGSVTGLPSWLKLDPFYSGTATYTWEQNLDKISENCGFLVLDLGEVHEIAELEVNNTFVGISVVPPYRFDIKPFIKRGVNHFKVRVTNVVSNKMRRNSELEDIAPSWKKDREVLAIETESGLLGPVVMYAD